VVVDPGVDFVENLYRSGRSISDIDMIIVTHDHVDHLGALDPLLSLLFERTEIMKDENSQVGSTGPTGKLAIYVNPSVLNRYAEVKNLWKGYDFRPIQELVRDPASVAGARGFPSGFQIGAVSSQTFDGVGHKDLGGFHSYGLHFTAMGGPSLGLIGDAPAPRTKDAKAKKRWTDAWSPLLDSDAVVAHLSTVPLTELRQLDGLDASSHPRVSPDDIEDVKRRVDRLSAAAARLLAVTGSSREFVKFVAVVRAVKEAAKRLSRNIEGEVTGRHLRSAVSKLASYEGALPSEVSSQEISDFQDEADSIALKARELPTDSTELDEIRTLLQNADRDENLQGRIEFAMWLRSGRARRSGKRGPRADLVGLVPGEWRPPQGHLYLGGILTLAEQYKELRGDRPGLFIIGELSEELGTARTQVAARLNHRIFETEHPDPERRSSVHALTSDIGLRAFLGPHATDKPEELGGGGDEPADGVATETGATVLCTICNLDMDRTSLERFHDPRHIREVCVKGENEGVFYNCQEHDPGNQANHTFLEQLERFDVFGR
jgi:hypothetical protein